MGPAERREAARLRALEDYSVFEEGDETLRGLVTLAAQICGTPIALVSIVDDHRQWFAARVGLDAQETPRDQAFCAHVVVAEADDLFIVDDARRDARFADNPLVVGDPRIVFYAGAPLVVETGEKLGTLCVIDREARVLDASQRKALETLSAVVVQHLALRRMRRIADEERARAESATAALLAESARQRDELAALFVHAPVAICLLEGPTHVIALANPLMCRMWGRREGVVLHRPFFEALPELAGQGLTEVLANVLRTASAVVGRALPVRIARGKDGLHEDVYFDVVYQPMPDPQGVVDRILVVAHEVTDSVLANAQTAKTSAERARLLDEARAAQAVAEVATRTMDDFLATVSHELRTPLNAILGWARLLRNNQVPESKREKGLETIERNAVAQAELIEDLLDVSRIVSGKMRIETSTIDVSEVVEAAVESVRLAANAKHVALGVRVEAGATVISADEARLRQVVWNILTNAVKFTPAGGRVDVLVTPTGDAVEIRVTDTGRGIDPGFLPHIFDRFRQAEAGSTRAVGGLGIGLAIVKNLVDMHGGTVRAESDGVGTGARFVVTMPRVAPVDGDASEPAPKRASSAPPSSRGETDEGRALEGRRLLLVDDEADARDLLVAIFEEHGAVVSCASNVDEAMAAVTRQRPDVVVSDIGMPGEDGFVLIGRLRALAHEAGGATPVVALTGYARSEDRTRALRAGFSAYVPKPISPREVLTVVRRLLREGPAAPPAVLPFGSDQGPTISPSSK